MRRLLSLITLVVVIGSGSSLGMAQGASAASKAPAFGRPHIVQGFSVTVLGVQRAHEAGSVDYVAGHGDIFLIVSVQVKRQGSHGTYVADPQDFHIQLSSGTVVDSEVFGMAHELTARHVYSHPVQGMVGFEVPAADKHLILLWQPQFSQAPDDQATWMIGTAGKVISYYH